MRVETIYLNEERDVTLSAWISDVGGEFAPVERRPAILILPGGGYAACSDREADPVGAAYLRAGFQIFILRYSVGEHRTWPNPLDDYEQAMETIRGNGEKWHVDVTRVAVVGFSAGGHLAACAATVARNRPNAAILGYAALNKEVCDVCQPGMPYPAECVDGKTPACFLFATRDDMVVDIRNTLDFEKALADKGISFESHIYSFGVHGFATGESWLNPGPISDRAKDWVGDSIAWLGELWGVFGPEGFTAPAFEARLNADCSPMLSADCTIAHLKRQEDEVQEILADSYQLIDVFLAERFGGSDAARDLIGGYKLSYALQTLQVGADKILEIDAKLKGFPNKQDTDEKGK